MTAKVLESKSLTQLIKQDLSDTITLACQQGLRAPGLAVILVGQDPASEIYVQHKQKGCKEVGIQSFCYHLAKETDTKTLMTLIERLNQDANIDGILVQLPLPSHIDNATILECISPQKDVDGFHPYNLGRLMQSRPYHRPCTPYGIIQLLMHHQILIAGQHAVVIGASNIVGRPMGLEFLYAKATPTVCHRQTRHLEMHVRHADILVIATGIPDLIKTQWLKQNQVIVDVGIHRQANGKIRGDLDYEAARNIVSAITPVPGGVGPMTVASLLQNTVKSWQDQRLNA